MTRSPALGASCGPTSTMVSPEMRTSPARGGVPVPSTRLAVADEQGGRLSPTAGRRRGKNRRAGWQSGDDASGGIVTDSTERADKLSKKCEVGSAKAKRSGNVESDPRLKSGRLARFARDSARARSARRVRCRASAGVCGAATGGRPDDCARAEPRWIRAAAGRCRARAADWAGVWIEQQLQPERIPDAAVEARLRSFEPSTSAHVKSLSRYFLPAKRAKKARKAEQGKRASGQPGRAKQAGRAGASAYRAEL